MSVAHFCADEPKMLWCRASVGPLLLLRLLPSPRSSSSFVRASPSAKPASLGLL
jgi:hypothetical protein